MNKELIKQVEQLIEFGYGDTLRLDSIVDALRNERSLYSSDQKYVDALISKYLYPQVEEVQDLKNHIDFLENKLKNRKEENYRTDKVISKSISANYCNSCGSTMLSNYDFCPKCGVHQNKNNLNDNRTQLKSPRHIASIILGILGGLIAIGVGIFAFFVGSVVSIFSYVEPGLVSTLTGLSFVAGILGIIGGSIGRRAGGVLSIIASFLALLGGGFFGILPFILLIIGGIVSLSKER